MPPTLAQASLHVCGRPANRLPDCCGIYRFFSDQDQLLYVGKSVDLATRIASHFTAAREPGRAMRMMQAVARIDCQPCAGEVGALLRENTAIKSEIPLLNRRQRRLRKLWTMRLKSGAAGFVRVEATDFYQRTDPDEDVFGLYSSRNRIDETLRGLAREHGLCLRTLGLDPGRGACFQRQLGRCRGACQGLESAAGHNARLRSAIARERIAAWPFAGAVLLRERAATPAPQQPASDWHLVDRWAYVGSFGDRRHALRALQTPDAGVCDFDRDAYRILLRAMAQGCVETLCAATGKRIDNPLAKACESA